MIDNTLIQAEFATLIGFRRGLDHRDSDIDEDLKESTTGLYVDEIHPLFTATNLEATMDENSSFVSLRTYDDEEIYSKWDIVKHGNDIYYSLKNDNEGHALSDTEFWKKTTLYSHYLRAKRNASIANLINEIGRAHV